MQNITLNTLFTTEQVAKNYGISQNTIRDHLKNHFDELIENIHFVTHKNDRNRPLVKWTLKGIVVLGFFIRSPQAKNFRIWASEQLERELLKQAQEFNDTRARNLTLADKVISLEAAAKLEAQNHKNAVNGYRSQISRRNNQIATLKRELAKFEDKKQRMGDISYENLKALYHNTRLDSEYFKKQYKEKELKERAIGEALSHINGHVKSLIDYIYD
ncbi:hypothetical protein [uncultured Campylobacter sp.]|uniref:hypothetical protein n=1 Tax=uncultured Campylobacter sp. TaxID=218934 RepID=UPI00261C55F6|nr:hypothetical protein [uncultured Campylobacter sp.]